jgi:hypothetical protein
MKRNYTTFLNPPKDIEKYLSARLLNENYWENCFEKKDQNLLEQKARQWTGINFKPHETVYDIETKIEDIADIHPVVPKLCDKQGLLFIWTIPLHKANDPSSDAILFKTEAQSVKSSVPDSCEIMIAQVHEYEDFTFVASVKYYNYIGKLDKEKRTELCMLVWKTLTSLYNKPLYAPGSSMLNRAHNLLNGKNIQHEPYNSKLLRRIGFKKYKFKDIDLEHLYFEPTDSIWKYEHKSCTEFSL